MYVKATVTTWWCITSELEQRASEMFARCWPGVAFDIRAIWAPETRRICLIETDGVPAQWVQRIQLLCEQAADDMDDDLAAGRGQFANIA